MLMVLLTVHDKDVIVFNRHILIHAFHHDSGDELLTRTRRLS